MYFGVIVLRWFGMIRTLLLKISCGVYSMNLLLKSVLSRAWNYWGPNARYNVSPRLPKTPLRYTTWKATWCIPRYHDGSIQQHHIESILRRVALAFYLLLISCLSRATLVSISIPITMNFSRHVLIKPWRSVISNTKNQELLKSGILDLGYQILEYCMLAGESKINWNPHLDPHGGLSFTYYV